MRARCCRCGKRIKSLEGYSFVAYDECRDKTCPNCKKTRDLGEVYVLVLDDMQRSSASCIKCKKMTDAFMNRKGDVGGICIDCFLAGESEKGCICYSESAAWYCSLCKKIHAPEGICSECSNSSKNIQTFLRVILPASIVGLIIGFFLCWLFLIKLHKKSTK